jgi:hypothetical protein
MWLRIYWLTKQGRETPDLPREVVLKEHEWKVRYASVRDEPPPSEPPSPRDAIRMIATLGGLLGRKSDGEPGTTSAWRGLVRLDNIVRA